MVQPSYSQHVAHVLDYFLAVLSIDFHDFSLKPSTLHRFDCLILRFYTEEFKLFFTHDVRFFL